MAISNQFKKTGTIKYILSIFPKQTTNMRSAAELVRGINLLFLKQLQKQQL
jgi:hypothetical protein